MYICPDIEEAYRRRDAILVMLDTLAPKAVPILDEGFDDITVVFGIPEMYRKRLHTSYSIERLNEEIRRRKRVIRSFTNEENITRLIGSLLLEQHEKWISGKTYFPIQNMVNS